MPLGRGGGGGAGGAAKAAEVTAVPGRPAVHRDWQARGPLPAHPPPRGAGPAKAVGQRRREGGPSALPPPGFGGTGRRLPPRSCQRHPMSGQREAVLPFQLLLKIRFRAVPGARSGTALPKACPRSLPARFTSEGGSSLLDSDHGGGEQTKKSSQTNSRFSRAGLFFVVLEFCLKSDPNHHFSQQVGMAVAF